MRQGKEASIKCQEEPRASRLVQSLLWEELLYLTGCSLGWGAGWGEERDEGGAGAGRGSQTGFEPHLLAL